MVRDECSRVIQSTSILSEIKNIPLLMSSLPSPIVEASPQITRDYQTKVLIDDIQSLKQRCSSLSDEAIKRSKYYSAWSLLGKVIVLLFSFTITTISANGTIGDKSWIILSLSSTIALVHSLMMYLPSEGSATRMREYSNQLLGISRRASSLNILFNPVATSLSSIDDMHEEVDALSVKIYDMSPTQDVSQVKRASFILRGIPQASSESSRGESLRSGIREIRSRSPGREMPRTVDVEMVKIDIGGADLTQGDVVHDMGGEDEKMNEKIEESGNECPQRRIECKSEEEEKDHLSQIIDPPSTNGEEEIVTREGEAEMGNTREK